jgi:NAD/NADP transhydrogenase beta subunit
MARTHHRKKHKEHVRQFKQEHESANPASSSSKAKTTNLFTIIGAATGLGISYFAAGADILWLAVGLVAGGIIGFYIGRKIDSDK